MKILKAGDIVKIEDADHKRILDKITFEQETAHTAFLAASEMVAEAHRRLWDFLHETHPETIGRRARYVLADHSIEIMGIQREGG